MPDKSIADQRSSRAQAVSATDGDHVQMKGVWRKARMVAARVLAMRQPTEAFYQVMSTPGTAAAIAWLGLFLGVAVECRRGSLRTAGRAVGVPDRRDERA